MTSATYYEQRYMEDLKSVKGILRSEILRVNFAAMWHFHF